MVTLFYGSPNESNHTNEKSLIWRRRRMNKITIIGSGSVGSIIAYTLTIMGLASEIVMIDINGEKALGEALDIRQGTPFCNPSNIYAGSYADAEDSNIVIITSGLARKPGQTRLDLAQINVDITKKIIPEIVRYAPDAFLCHRQQSGRHFGLYLP